MMSKLQMMRKLMKRLTKRCHPLKRRTSQTKSEMLSTKRGTKAAIDTTTMTTRITRKKGIKTSRATAISVKITKMGSLEEIRGQGTATMIKTASSLISGNIT